MKKCQEKVILLYLMNRKDCLLRFFYRIKTQLVEIVNGPFTLKVRKRLGHVAGLQEMEFIETEDKIDMVAEYSNDYQDIEFVGVENDIARVEPQTDAHSQSDENWDDDVLNNNSENVNPFPIDAMNSELDCPNLEELRVEPLVQPLNGEELGETTTTSELISDPDVALGGNLSFRFTIENISAFCSQANRVISESFKCRNIPFHLLVLSNPVGHFFSVFLERESTGDDTKDNGLEIVISTCHLSVLDQLTGISKTRTLFNRTYRGQSDWGFSDFFNTSGQRVFPQGVVYNNTLVIHVDIKSEPPYCYSHYSKEITGCVGIRNQGATCYMNSLLEVLFFLTKFRTACYRIPTECDENSSMPLALQKVFYNLQFSDASVCTRNLTKSFGWSNVDVLMQHDIQEMMRVLIEKIESRMKNTLLEPILPSMFQGKFISYVKCRDIEFSSQREEVFYDIQLSLENANNVLESFKRYVSAEMMDGDNKYHAGTHGLQAAEKGTLFMSLPPVLFLHLLRFQFDGLTSQVMKNNNYFEFYEHIDLTEFVREEDGISWKYTLFAVLSHSGGGSHGHYVAYINPSLKDGWLKFDDDVISLVSQWDAIDANFGNNNDVNEWSKSMQLNAYMLVYVRDSDANTIFEPVDPKYISEELMNSIKNDSDSGNYNKMNNYHHYTTDYVVLSSFLESEFRFNFRRIEQHLPKFVVTRDLTFNGFKDELQNAFRITGDNQIRIWPIMHRPTYSHPVYINGDAPFLQTLAQCKEKYTALPFSVWVEMALPGTELPSFNPENNVIVFYHYYCALECRPFYINHGYHDKNAKLDVLIPILNQLMGWSNRELNIYEDLRETRCCPLNMSNIFSDCAQRESNILLMDIVFEATDHDTSTKLNSILSYYQDILCRAHIAICNVDHAREEEQFEMSLQSTFPELLDKLARRLNYDKNKIQIFLSAPNKEGRGDPIPCSSTKPLLQLLTPGGNPTILMFYKQLTIDVMDVETKHSFSFMTLAINMKKSVMHTLYLSDGETIESILAEAGKIIDSDPTHGSGEFRAICINENRLSLVEDSTEIYKYIEAVKSEGNAIYKRKYYRIEEIPKGDEFLNDNEKYVMVQQCRYFVIPAKAPPHSFIFKVNMNESWQCVKDRLRCRLNLWETTWADYRPVVLSQDDEVDVDDTKCLNDYEQLSSMFYICLNYKSYKATRSCSTDLSCKPTNT